MNDFLHALPLVLISIAVSLFVSLTLTHLLIQFAPRLHLIDLPNERKVHHHPVPKGGGLAIYFATLIAVLLLSLDGQRFPHLSSALPLLLMGFVLVLLGLIDDLRPLPWQMRIAVHAAVALLVVLRWPPDAGLLVRAAGVVWIVAMINAFNMLDNMDALSGGVAAIAALMLALSGVAAPAPLLMLSGAVAGFLWFNRPPARIFMGDAGSTFLGFFLSAASLSLVPEHTVQASGAGTALACAACSRPWLVAFCVLAVAWYDMITVVTIRLRQRRSPFHADKQHLSHRLVERGWSPPVAVGVIHLLAILTGLAGVAAAHAPLHLAALLGASVMVVAIAMAAVDHIGWG